MFWIPLLTFLIIGTYPERCITNSPSSPLVPLPKTRLGILFSWAFASLAMIRKKEPFHRRNPRTNIVHTVLLSSISRGLVDGHFHKPKNKQSLRQTQSPRAGWRVHSRYRHWFLPAKSFQSRRKIGKRKKVHCALLTSYRLTVSLACRRGESSESRLENCPYLAVALHLLPLRRNSPYLRDPETDTNGSRPRSQTGKKHHRPHFSWVDYEL